MKQPLLCMICGNEWKPKTWRHTRGRPLPRECPHCRSTNWRTGERANARKTTEYKCSICGATWKRTDNYRLKLCPVCRSRKWETGDPEKTPAKDIMTDVGRKIERRRRAKLLEE